MSHITDMQQSRTTEDGRSLGDEWANWDGSGGGTTRAGKTPFLVVAAIFALLLDALVIGIVYMISPRLAGWAAWLPAAAWIAAILFVLLSTAWFVQLLLTATSGRNAFITRGGIFAIFSFALEHIFRLAGFAGISRDRMGHSFVRVSNAVARATKGSRGVAEERLLILLPRCLTKEQLKAINALKERYPLTIATVSGGELARKKVREVRPTAVIGVACERDLVSGIRDVGNRFSVIGIPNDRPEGPCKNTVIDMDELIETIEFYVGPPASHREPDEDLGEDRVAGGAHRT